MAEWERSVSVDRSPLPRRPGKPLAGVERRCLRRRRRVPGTPGHSLVIPRRLSRTWWETTEEERSGLWALVDVIKRRLDAGYQPDGYNVGFNAGPAAGQTVGHFHLHVISRHTGDVADARGGIRNVMPGRGNYLLAPQPDLPPLFDGQERTLRLELLRCLRSELFDRIDLVVSFIMKSGLEIVSPAMQDANPSAEHALGFSQPITSRSPMPTL